MNHDSTAGCICCSVWGKWGIISGAVIEGFTGLVQVVLLSGAGMFDVFCSVYQGASVRE